MSQDGQLIVNVPRALTMRFSSLLYPGPRVPATVLTVLFNGSPLGEYAVPKVNTVDFAAPLAAGENHIVFRSSAPPLEPGNGDPRKMSIQIVDPQIQFSDL